MTTTRTEDERRARDQDPSPWARDLAQRLVEAAKRAGADASDAAVGLGSSLSASARDGTIEDVTRASSRAASVRVVVDGRLGFATSADAPKDARTIDELAETAVALARLSTPSPHNVIPQAPVLDDATLEARVKALASWDDKVAEATADWAMGQALTLERVLSSTEGISGVRGVDASTRRGCFALATSTGFSGAYRGTSCRLSASGIIEESGGKKQVEGSFAASRSFAKLTSAEEVAREAAKRVLARRGARKVPTARLPVIFDPNIARGFFGAVLDALCGDQIARKQSFLASQKGEIVLAPGYVVVDDPSLVGGFASRPFDGEGLPCERLELIDVDGRARTFLHDARSASRLGEAPTGHASRGSTSLPSPSPTNVTVLGGTGSLESIIADTPRGLVVTRLLGHGPDMATGEYSRGAAGYWIEGGAIAFPVEEITIAGHMLEMMRGIDRMGADLDERTTVRTPTLRFAELAISGL